MTVSSLRDRIIAEMGTCHSDPSYTYPSPQEWQLDNPHAMSKTLAEVLGKAIYPEISSSTLLAWREAVINYYDPTTSLPPSPSVDDRYISTATANGWTIHYIYTWDGSSWTGFSPGEGCTVYNKATDVHQTFNGSTWGALTTVTKLDDIQGPDSSHTITMADKTLTWRFTNPAGGIFHEWTGAASGHLFELNQNTGNPAPGTHLLHIQASDNDVDLIHVRHSSATNSVFISDVTGDFNNRFMMTAAGVLLWGSGAAAGDTNLYRPSAGVLKTDGSFEIGDIPDYTAGTNILVSHAGVVKKRVVSDDILSITDFDEAVDDRVYSLLVQGSGIDLSYNDVANSLTVSLSKLGIENLSDPGADQILFWDDSAGYVTWLSIGNGLQISGNVLSEDISWSDISGKPTNLITGSLSDGFYVRATGTYTVTYAQLQDTLVGGTTWYTDCWSRFRIVTPDTNSSSSKVVVFGASNELERRDIDSRVWGSSLLSMNALSTNNMPKYGGSSELVNSLVGSGDYNITVTSPVTSQTYQIQMVNGSTARSYIGQFGGSTFITNNRYYTGGSWHANDPAQPGARYIAALNGHHQFYSSPSSSVGWNLDFEIDGTDGYVESHHDFRLGGNSISNNGTGGLTFDSSGEGTFSASLNVTSNLYLGGSVFATNNTSRTAIFGALTSSNGAYALFHGRDHASLAGQLSLVYGGYDGVGEFAIDHTETDGSSTNVLSISSDGSITVNADLTFAATSGFDPAHKLTCDNVDIGGGEIDDTTIGSNSRSPGYFTVLESSTGAVLSSVASDSFLSPNNDSGVMQIAPGGGPLGTGPEILLRGKDAASYPGDTNITYGGLASTGVFRVRRYNGGSTWNTIICTNVGESQFWYQGVQKLSIAATLSASAAFHLGTNSISNDGDGGLVFDTYGGATLTHTQSTSTNGLVVARSGQTSLGIYAGSTTYGGGLLTDGDPVYLTSNNDVTNPELKVHDGTVTIDPGTKAYRIGNTTGEELYFRSESNNSYLSIISNDEDGEDSVGVQIWGLGGLNSRANRERMVIHALSDATNITSFDIYSESNGTGSDRPVRLAAGSSNFGQLNLLANGNVTMANDLTVSGDLTVDDTTTIKGENIETPQSVSLTDDTTLSTGYPGAVITDTDDAYTVTLPSATAAGQQYYVTKFEGGSDEITVDYDAGTVKFSYGGGDVEAYRFIADDDLVWHRVR